jgi:LAO/AO transport system kinase
LSKTTGDVVTVLDAAGFDRIIVETVGVGQAEVEIASTAHTTLVVEAPGLGDEVQAIKAGILEIADILVSTRPTAPAWTHAARLEMMLEIEGDGTRYGAPSRPTAARGERRWRATTKSRAGR